MILFRVLSNTILFRVLSDRVFFRVLSEIVIFNVSLIFCVLFYIMFSKWSSHLIISLRCINNLNKIDSEKYKKILAW